MNAVQPKQELQKLMLSLKADFSNEAVLIFCQLAGRLLRLFQIYFCLCRIISQSVVHLFFLLVAPTVFNITLL